jgi:hypothetical protein
VKPPREVKHVGGQIDEGQPEPGLQMDRVVAAAAAQLQDVMNRVRRRRQDGPDERGLLRIVIRR